MSVLRGIGGSMGTVSSTVKIYPISIPAMHLSTGPDSKVTKQTQPRNAHAGAIATIAGTAYTALQTAQRSPTPPTSSPVNASPATATAHQRPPHHATAPTHSPGTAQPASSTA